MTDRPESPNPYASPTVAAADSPAPISARAITPLLILFGTLYFVQGIVEPTAGMLAQPTQSQLQNWGRTPAQVSSFLGFIGIPWSLKLLFGLVSDFFPIFGRRRWPYLVLSTAVTGVAFGWLGLGWGHADSVSLYAWILMLTCGAVAMTDVVIDALAVETGQPLGLTGQLQSVQWGAMSAATILGGMLGGYVAQRGLLNRAFLGCALLAAISLVVVLATVREPRRQHSPAADLRQAWKSLTTGRRLLILLVAGAYLFLWNFNPFSSNVQQHYVTEVLKLSEQFYGNLYSVQAAAQMVACVAYGLVCRRIPFGWLIHGSVVAGILSTFCYWPMHDATTAVLASIVFGLTYQLGTLIQLDLAARICPIESAGTIFALLMAISNTGMTASIWVSGGWYDALSSPESLGSRHAAFDALVAIGAAFTAGCWLLVPLMKWAGVEWR
jgi:MFS family permease